VDQIADQEADPRAVPRQIPEDLQHPPGNRQKTPCSGG
jgi:hypothetical protein